MDRRSEIEAIFQDLEERRLQALYDGDREAFKALFANDEYMERSLVAFDLVEFDGPPSVRVEIVEVVADQPTCIAAHRILDRLDLDQVSEVSIGVLEMTGGTISDISPLAKLVNLEKLVLSHNRISDISSLAHLTNLKELALSGNSIGDISALVGLKRLEVLDLGENSISDIASLSGLINLRILDVAHNVIDDIAPPLRPKKLATKPWTIVRVAGGNQFRVTLVRLG
jgi:hypothetical protein